MRESVFRFKQFSVRNSLAAMKVGTDGVLLGAWCNVENGGRVLDIGTGTGLIALMIAQRNERAIIDAVEIDNGASEEARFNINNSPWRERITVYNCDFREFAFNNVTRYDLIVSNPPFFQNGVLPPDKSRMQARHCTSLSYTDLLTNAAILLSPNGIISIIAPADVENTILEVAKANGLSVDKKTYVIPKPSSTAKRILWEISLQNKGCSVDEIIIETENHHEYTPQYISLTKEFYLNM